MHQSLGKERHARNVLQALYKRATPVAVFDADIAYLLERPVDSFAIKRKVIGAYADTTNPANVHQVLNVSHEIFNRWLPIPAIEIADIGTEVHADDSAFFGNGADLP